MKKITLLLFVVLTGIMKVNAQDIENILLANRDDASKLTSAYMSPAMKGLIYSMNGGWYHTAKVHKKFGFDITIGANASFIPTKDEVFNVANLGLASTTVINGVTTTPTLAGSKDTPVAKLETSLRADGTPLSVPLQFDLPTGVSDDLPLAGIPAPAIQIGIGLPFKLDATLRLVPKVGTDNVKGGLWGLGVKREFTDLLGPLDKLPLHLSLLAAYTNMSVDYKLDPSSSGNVITNNGATEFKLNAYTVQAIASINFPIINFYGSVGYNGGNTQVNMLGDYILNYGGGVSQSISNPFSVKNSTGSFNATIGTRLSLGFFKIFGSYSLQEYNTVNAGIAFSFR